MTISQTIIPVVWGRKGIASAVPFLVPKLTPKLLRVFIRRIEVYEKFEKYSRTAGNPIRIHYAFRLPEQEGIPAIEVLAEPTAKTA